MEHLLLGVKRGVGVSPEHSLLVDFTYEVLVIQDEDVAISVRRQARDVYIAWRLNIFFYYFGTIGFGQRARHI